jgi:hypothetical protein
VAHSAKGIVPAPIAIALVEEISDCVSNQLIGGFVAAAGDLLQDLFFPLLSKTGQGCTEAC